VDADLPLAQPEISFKAADCETFARYPERVHWDKTMVALQDQETFRSVRSRLQSLAGWAASVAPTNIELRRFVSTLQPNGLTPEDMWCCVYPSSAPNKSYALQVALIISAEGAELCLCLGSGTSQLKQPELRRDGEQYLRAFQNKLRSTPEPVEQDVAAALPEDVRYLTSWRQQSRIANSRAFASG
jgi:hypothetical protein